MQPGSGTSLVDTSQRGELLYVSDTNNGVVRIYTYPQLTVVGALRVRDPEGICVDDRARTIWVVSTVYSEIVEFARGGTAPIKTLKDGTEYPDACAVDPASGDLAVANYNDQGTDPGSISIYRKSEGKAQLYSDFTKIYYVAFLTYDSKGNLFADGAGLTHPHFRLVELPRGASAFKEIRLTGARIESPGGLVYDKGGLAIGDQKRSVIFQAAHGKIVGHTPLGGACYVNQFVVTDGHVIVGNTCGPVNNPVGSALIYDYPRGGAPIQELTGFAVAWGIAIGR
ncbi:MAG: hypothetical protein JO311_01485 [Candidatus Eremiobacteraeota bacterium]|nr:hypothetical protein [Candidatus Eremiobacteraeota bacterium]